MSRGGDITLTCWDGEHTFRLRIGELRTLQEKCDAGPAFIAGRLRDGSWLVDDIRETLRLGLIGAGVKQQAALSLVIEHVDGVPLAENVVTAHAVLMAAVYGVGDEVLGKSVPAGMSPNENGENSPSPASTPSVPPSESVQPTSI